MWRMCLSVPIDLAIALNLRVDCWLWAEQPSNRLIGPRILLRDEPGDGLRDRRVDLRPRVRAAPKVSVVLDS